MVSNVLSNILSHKMYFYLTGHIKDRNQEIWGKNENKILTFWNIIFLRKMLVAWRS